MKDDYPVIERFQKVGDHAFCIIDIHSGPFEINEFNDWLKKSKFKIVTMKIEKHKFPPYKTLEVIFKRKDKK